MKCVKKSTKKHYNFFYKVFIFSRKDVKKINCCNYFVIFIVLSFTFMKDNCPSTMLWLAYRKRIRKHFLKKIVIQHHKKNETHYQNMYYCSGLINFLCLPLSLDYVNCFVILVSLFIQTKWQMKRKTTSTVINAHTTSRWKGQCYFVYIQMGIFHSQSAYLCFAFFFILNNISFGIVAYSRYQSETHAPLHFNNIVLSQ